MGHLMAESGSWDWSDGFKGTGNMDAIFEQFAKTWGFMVNTVSMNTPMITIDTDNSVVVVCVAMNILIDGGLADQKHLVANNCVFKFTLEEGKAKVWDAWWDNSDPNMKKALGAVTDALKSR
jgi:hypothetical protein